MSIQDELARRYLGRRVRNLGKRVRSEQGVEGRITEIDHENALLKVEFLPNQSFGLFFKHCWYDLSAFQGEHKLFTIIKPRMKPVEGGRWACFPAGDSCAFAFASMEQAYVHYCLMYGEPAPSELVDKYIRNV
ncbi:MAG: hypothetical protein CMO80_22100 [Verrucomicrobiales bacterium]|nr:hypothetical protein [Verrucomicrobiales bacterium]|tara:strand:+ start:20021 stop:20419 length:399 start_codon:yes stop_codon:yes gene_type:complete